jgi:cell division initiation protein
MLTPLDIQNAVFRRSWRGYNEAEVDEFLDRLVVEYEQLHRENLALKARRAGEEEAAPAALAEERAPWTPPAADPALWGAREAAAGAETERLAGEAERLRQAIREENRRLEALRRQRRLFATQFQAMLESYRDLLAENEEQRTSAGPEADE